MSLLLVTFSTAARGLPVKFDEDRRIVGQHRSLQDYEEARIFHAHAMRKRKKKKLIHCLLSLQRSNHNHARVGDPRTLFFNYVNLNYNHQGGSDDDHYSDEEGGGGGNNCLSQLTGGSDSGGSGIGEGINNLSSLVGQVGEIPSNIVSSVGEGVKPIFENPERYLNRYFLRPLYRSLRPLYDFI